MPLANQNFALPRFLESQFLLGGYMGRRIGRPN